MSGVNLDAYIRREDLRFPDEKYSNEDYSTIAEIALNDLEKGKVIFSLLRKPDFQRETDDWEINKVTNLVENFLDGDLIPSIILWRSPKNLIFVLDGAHRLSALAAWVNDDFGDGGISRNLYGNEIPEEQLNKAKKTRELIEDRVGSYQDHIEVDLSEETKRSERAKKLSLRKIDIQWVRGNEQKAEESFFRINQNASKVSPTEIYLLKNRKSPLTISARAIIRGGTGHKYWGKFKKDIQEQVEKTAKDIHSMLFNPAISKGVLNTINLPMGGIPHSNATLTMIYELVENINKDYYVINENVDEEDFQLNLFDYLEGGLKRPLSGDDVDGKMTLQVLINCKKLFERINSKSNGSLGLNPVIYFYSHRTGNFQVSSLMMTVEFVKYLGENGKFNEFISVRDKVEAFLVKNNYFLEQTIVKYGSGTKSYKHLYQLLLTIYKQIVKECEEEKIVEYLITGEFSYLTISPKMSNEDNVNFSSNNKNGIYISEAIKNALRCKICGGYIHENSISYDHKVRKADGGTGEIGNAQLTHPYCNSVYKN